MLTDALIEKFSAPGPYYSSYPTLSEWTPAIGATDYLAALDRFVPLAASHTTSLYIHIPFCPKQCFYCICNAIITHDQERIANYIKHLIMELDLLFGYFKNRGSELKISDIHLGGGSPSFLDDHNFMLLMQGVAAHVDIKRLKEFSIEVDPRNITEGTFERFKNAGITRLSFGVQDFDPKVQNVINRIQPFELLQSLLTNSLRRDFPSINFDILYGLPLQTRETFAETIQRVISLSPDRITLIRYAHIPESRSHQRMLDNYLMPDKNSMAKMFFDAAYSLKEAGWEHVGIDHFAKPDDTLAIAQKHAQMTRSFIGCSPGWSKNLLGVGPTTTVQLEDFYGQSCYHIDDYFEAVSKGVFPIFRGYCQTRDDQIRRNVINMILCAYKIDAAILFNQYGISFADYFGEEINALQVLAQEGMLTFNNSGIEVTTLGRYFLRHICKIFDKFLVNGKEYRVSGP